MHVYLCTTRVPGAHGGKKKASDPLEMELQTIVSHHVVLGTKPRVLQTKQEVVRDTVH